MRNLFKKLAVPLQAFSALGICLGMSWMIFVVANFNPTPPTVLDLQARSTEENLSFSSMNSTAAALAFEMVVDMVPSPIVMPVTGNSTPTLSASPTIVVTLRVVSSASETETPFSLFSLFFQPTPTRKPRIDPPTLTATQVPTGTPIPTSTPTRLPTRPPTRVPTRTPVPPTVTRLPSRTPAPVTPTPTTELIPTITIAVPTTPVLPTATVIPTQVLTEPPPTGTEEQTLTSEPIQETPEPVETITEAP